MFNIDRACKLTTKPEMLNALHACRKDHPLNKTTKNPWYNAYFLAVQQKNYSSEWSGVCRWLLDCSIEANETI